MGGFYYLCAMSGYIITILLDKLSKAVEHTGVKTVAIGGGVSANSGVRAAIADYCMKQSLKAFIPERSFTTDTAFTGRIPAKTSTGLSRIGYLESRVIELRTVPKGHTFGYGAGYVAKDATRVAVVPVGYTDGFSVEKKKDLYRNRDILRYILAELKKIGGRGNIYITINGQRARVLGHVGLCHVSCDVTGLDVHNGDTAILDVNPLYLSPLVPKEYV